MSKELPAGPATAPKKSISKPSESQKFQEVTEKFDDKKLARDVAEVSDLIAKWNKTEAQKHLQSVLVETDGVGTGNLTAYVEGLDFQNRAKNGRIVTMPYGGVGLSIEEDMRTLVKNGSNLAKLMQLYVIAFDGSVQMTDSRKVLAGVDGNLERFSMLGISELKKTIGAQKATEKLKSDILQLIVGKWVKWIGVDTLGKIENEQGPDANLRAKRKMDVEVVGNIVRMTSFGQVSTLDLSDGKMMFGDLLMLRKYPVSVNLVRDRDDKNAPIMIESEINRKNIQNAIQLMNFVHFAVSEFMNPERLKSIRNQEAPFYAMHQGNIKIHDSMAKITDTNVASKELVYSLLKEFTTNQNLAPESMARLLNDIYRSNVPSIGPNPKSDIFVGGNKPIEKKETP